MANIFVFGSNLLGIHGAGAAKHARHFYGAEVGVGVGRTGNSYAIPTKATPSKTLPLNEIRGYVQQFLEYANSRYWETFNVTAIGCGLAGYTPTDIAPMFSWCPENVNLPQEFLKVIHANKC